MQIVVGPVLTKQGGYAFDCWTPERGLSRGAKSPKDGRCARFVADSVLEERGFELWVPGEIGHRVAARGSCRRTLLGGARTGSGLHRPERLFVRHGRQGQPAMELGAQFAQVQKRENGGGGANSSLMTLRWSKRDSNPRSPGQYQGVSSPASCLSAHLVARQRARPRR